MPTARATIGRIVPLLPPSVGPLLGSDCACSVEAWKKAETDPW
jgi:hypothetical protein